jgi:hypothetical protein
MLVYASSFDLIEKTETRIKRGALVSGISDISSKYIDVVRENEDIGEEVRHYDRYEGMYFKVADKKESVSSINVEAESLSLEDSVVALLTETRTMPNIFYPRLHCVEQFTGRTADTRAI